jgi:hypothetical protein
MFRTQLPRFYELKDLIADPCAPDAAFQGFETLLAEPHCLAVFASWERELQGLDNAAWQALRDEALPYLSRRSSGGRGWQQLFDILGQARAYNYLKQSVGCSTVRFIPRSNVETPDLEGFLLSGRMLCEVKTVNISDEEVRARKTPAARFNSDQLPEGFFRKLDSDILKAKRQLPANDPACNERHLVYVNICFDDWVGTYRTNYAQQIDQHLRDNPPGVDVRINSEP